MGFKLPCKKLLQTLFLELLSKFCMALLANLFLLLFCLLFCFVFTTMAIYLHFIPTSQSIIKRGIRAKLCCVSSTLNPLSKFNLSFTEFMYTHAQRKIKSAIQKC